MSSNATEKMLREMLRDQMAAMQQELAKYKSAVKDLTMQLELARYGADYRTVIVDEAAVRKMALEQAADHLMDHGIIRGGAELEEVCKQITQLRPTGTAVTAKKKTYNINVDAWV